MNALRAPLRPLRCFATRSLVTQSAPRLADDGRSALSWKDKRDKQAAYANRPGAGTSRGPRRSQEGDDEEVVIPEKTLPESKSYYTGRAGYYDQFNHLITAANTSRRALTALQLFPLPHFARKSLPPRQPAWRKREDMGYLFDRNLSTAEYSKVLQKLNQIYDYKRIADTAAIADLSEMIQAILELFERQDKAAFLNRGKRAPIEVDEYGRTYTVGRRKTSTARIWIIPVQGAFPEKQDEEPLVAPVPESVVSPAAPLPTPVEDVMDALEEAASGPISLLPKGGLVVPKEDEESPLFASEFTPPVQEHVEVTPSAILINNLPLSKYFPLPADRERVVRPLKMAGVLGAYNVFCLVRGGGTTGQSGAIMQGLAKGLARHEPKMASILRKSKLTFRDPRMVERKKTGRAKARKGYAWVRR